MGKISQQSIEQVAAANDIVEVIGGYFPLKRAGSSYVALCPFHREKSPSFHVNPQRQIYHCFGCGVGGSVFRFVMAYENVDFPTAVKRLAARAGITLQEEAGTEEDRGQAKERGRLLELHREAAEWFHLQLVRGTGAEATREYLKNRGIGIETARSWQLGFAPDSWDALARWAGERNYSVPELIRSGLVKLRDEEHPERGHYDRFRNRVMFPICNDLGEIIAFSGRVIPGDEGGAKYVNSPETPLFQKGSVLFGLHRAKRALIAAQEAVVCEGQLDLIQVFQAGIENVIAPQGTAFTPRQARILARYVKAAILCFDADSAGQAAAEKAFSPLLAHNLEIRVAEMPPGDDPDSLIRREGAEAFKARIASSREYFDFLLAREQPRLTTPKARADFARRLAVQVAQLTEPVLRDAVTGRVSAQLEISAEAFRQQIRNTKNAPQPAEEAAETTTEPPRLIHPFTAEVCLLLLRCPGAADHLSEQPWREVSQAAPDGDLVVRLMESEFDPEQPASVSAFLATLPPAEESAFTALLEKGPPVNIASADRCWRALHRLVLERRRDAVLARQRQPDLTPQMLLDAQKEVVDLTSQIADLL